MATATKKRPRKAAKRFEANRPAIEAKERLDLDPDIIRLSPFQPRRDFDPAAIAALGESMLAHGQATAICVRTIPGGGFELLTGERRLRAAKHVCMASIRADVFECNDVQARQIILAENLHREDLNKIEEADGFQMLLDHGDYAGPTELAESIGKSQPYVSNTLRLLGLPEFWRSKLISREITERHARAVLPYIDQPEAMKALEGALTVQLQVAGVAPSVADWERRIIPAVAPNSAPEEQDDSQGSTETPEAGGESEGTVADEPRQSATRGTEAIRTDFAGRLWEWKVMFLRHAIASQLRERASEAELLKVALLAMNAWERDIHEKDVIAVCAGVCGTKPRKSGLAALAGCSDIEAVKAAGRLLAMLWWFQGEWPGCAADFDEIVPIAKMLGVDLAEAWAAGDVPLAQAYWELHTKEQLLAIAKEVHLCNYLPAADDDGGGRWTLEAVSKKSRKTMIEMCMKAMAGPDSKDAGIPMPKEIAKAKPPKK